MFSVMIFDVSFTAHPPGTSLSHPGKHSNIRKWRNAWVTQAGHLRALPVRLDFPPSLGVY